MQYVYMLKDLFAHYWNSLSLYANEISTGSICPNLKMQILNDACFLVYKM